MKREENYVTCKELDLTIAPLRDSIEDIKQNHLPHIQEDIKETQKFIVKSIDDIKKENNKLATKVAAVTAMGTFLISWILNGGLL